MNVFADLFTGLSNQLFVSVPNSLSTASSSLFGTFSNYLAQVSVMPFTASSGALQSFASLAPETAAPAAPATAGLPSILNLLLFPIPQLLGL